MFRYALMVWLVEQDGRIHSPSILPCHNRDDAERLARLFNSEASRTIENRRRADICIAMRDAKHRQVYVPEQELDLAQQERVKGPKIARLREGGGAGYSVEDDD